MSSSTAEAEKEIARICKLEQSSPSMFQILGIDWQTATTKIVKTQYNKLVLLTHPDKIKVDRAADAFALITRAYKMLVNEALLERAKKSEEKKHGIAATTTASGNNGVNDESKKKEAEEEEEEKIAVKLREEYLAAVRAQEQTERRRQRETDENVEKEMEKEDINRHAANWQKFRSVAGGGGNGMKRL